MNRGPSPDFTLRGLDVVVEFFESEPEPEVRQAVGAFIDRLLEDPRSYRGVPVPGSTLNEVSLFVPDLNVAVTWFVAWGERVVWIRKVEHPPVVE